ncbi:MAG: hypothetical protein OEZ36_10550 [Spirochaetota bacterium]|nr:hypothetical protein [Spirochaetota bacterium]
MRIKLALFIVLISAGLSQAYIRAPYHSEKSFSGRIGTQRAVQSIALTKETMNIYTRLINFCQVMPNIPKSFRFVLNLAASCFVGQENPL